MTILKHLLLCMVFVLLIFYTTATIPIYTHQQQYQQHHQQQSTHTQIQTNSQQFTSLDTTYQSPVDIYGFPMKYNTYQYYSSGFFKGEYITTTDIKIPLSTSPSIDIIGTSTQINKYPNIKTAKIIIINIDNWTTIFDQTLIPDKQSDTIHLTTSNFVSIEYNLSYMIYITIEFDEFKLKSIINENFQTLSCGIIWSNTQAPKWMIITPYWIEDNRVKPRLGQLQSNSIRQPYPIYNPLSSPLTSTIPTNNYATISPNPIETYSQIRFQISLPLYLLPNEFNIGLTQYIGLRITGIGYLTLYDQISTQCLINDIFSVAMYNIPDTQYMIMDITPKLRTYLSTTGNNLISFSCDITKFAYVTPTTLTSEQLQISTFLTLTPLYLDSDSSNIIPYYNKYGLIQLPINLESITSPLNPLLIKTGSIYTQDPTTTTSPPSIHFLDKRHSKATITCQFEVNYPTLSSFHQETHSSLLDAFQFIVPLIRKADNDHAFISVYPINRYLDSKNNFGVKNTFSSMTIEMDPNGITPQQYLNVSQLLSLETLNQQQLTSFQLTIVVTGLINQTSYNNNDSICRLHYLHTSSLYNPTPKYPLLSIIEATAPLQQLYDYIIQRNDIGYNFELLSTTKPDFIITNTAKQPFRRIHIWFNGGYIIKMGNHELFTDSTPPPSTLPSYGTAECLDSNGRSDTIWRCGIESIKSDGNWFNVTMTNTLYNVYTLKITTNNIEYVDISTLTMNLDDNKQIGENQNEYQLYFQQYNPNMIDSTDELDVYDDIELQELQSNEQQLQQLQQLQPQQQPTKPPMTATIRLSVDGNVQSIPYATLGLSFDVGGNIPVMGTRGRPESTQDKIGPGGIAGVIIAVLIVTASITIFLIWFIMKKLKEKKEIEEEKKKWDRNTTRGPSQSVISRKQQQQSQLQQNQVQMQQMRPSTIAEDIDENHIEDDNDNDDDDSLQYSASSPRIGAQQTPSFTSQPSPIFKPQQTPPIKAQRVQHSLSMNDHVNYNNGHNGNDSPTLKPFSLNPSQSVGPLPILLAPSHVDDDDDEIPPPPPPS